MGKPARTKVFRDEKGNRMVFPSMIYYAREDEPLATELWQRGLLMRATTGLQMEDQWFEFDAEKFPHIRTEAGSQGFEYGRATVLLFDGPEFKQALSNTKD